MNNLNKATEHLKQMMEGVLIWQQARIFIRKYAKEDAVKAQNKLKTIFTKEEE